MRELAADLLPSTREISQGLVEHLTAALPELAAGDDELREEMLASAEANIDQVLRLPPARMPTRSWCRSRSPSTSAASYAAGSRCRCCCGPIASGTRGSGIAGRGRARAHRQPRGSSRGAGAEPAFMFAYVDRISDILVEDYGSERERMARGAAQLRADTVRSILAGEPIDEELAVQRLGYELRRHHVALRVSSSASEVRGLEPAAREAAAALGPGEPLVIPSGVASLDVWCGSYEPPTAAALEGYVPPDGVRVALGGSGRDVAGFRRTHAEAMQAARVAALAGDSATAVTSYQRVELVSLLAGDLPRARRFVAARLGPRRHPSPRSGCARPFSRSSSPGAAAPAPQRALRTPEHRDLSRQAGRGADGPAGQPQPGRTGVRAHAGRRPRSRRAVRRGRLQLSQPSPLWRDQGSRRNFVACAHRPRRRASVEFPCADQQSRRGADVRHQIVNVLADLPEARAGAEPHCACARRRRGHDRQHRRSPTASPARPRCSTASASAPAMSLR